MATMPDSWNALERARVCREQAALTTNRETRDLLLALARDFDEEAKRSGANQSMRRLQQSQGPVDRIVR